MQEHPSKLIRPMSLISHLLKGVGSLCYHKISTKGCNQVRSYVTLSTRLQTRNQPSQSERALSQTYNRNQSQQKMANSSLIHENNSWLNTYQIGLHWAMESYTFNKKKHSHFMEVKALCIRCSKIFHTNHSLPNIQEVRALEMNSE